MYTAIEVLKMNATTKHASDKSQATQLDATFAFT
jgi:hypothetical protein